MEKPDLNDYLKLSMDGAIRPKILSYCRGVRRDILSQYASSVRRLVFADVSSGQFERWSVDADASESPRSGHG